MKTINTNGVELSITVGGKPTRIYSHENRFFLESREGTEYAIQIKNDNWHRVEVVASVDGLSVLTGKTASKNDVGYVVQARETAVIKGFRSSLNDVGAFKFSARGKSYAASKRKRSNIGVIAFAVHKEKQPIWTYSAINTITVPQYTYTSPTFTTNGGTSTGGPTYGSTTGGAAGGCGNMGGILRSMNCSQGNVSNDMVASYHSSVTNSSVKSSAPQEVSAVNFAHGTTWGKKIEDKVTTTTFDREYLMFTSEVYYNSKENLETIGIKMIKEKQVAMPKGFPSDFATPPSGWQG